MVWFRKAGVAQKSDRGKPEIEGDWSRCPACSEIVWSRELEENLQVAAELLEEDGRALGWA